MAVGIVGLGMLAGFVAAGYALGSGGSLLMGLLTYSGSGLVAMLLAIAVVALRGEIGEQASDTPAGSNVIRMTDLREA